MMHLAQRQHPLTSRIHTADAVQTLSSCAAHACAQTAGFKAQHLSFAQYKQRCNAAWLM